jgi:hypothetical protein
MENSNDKRPAQAFSNLGRRLSGGGSDSVGLVQAAKGGWL